MAEVGFESRKSGPESMLLTSLGYDVVSESTEHVLNEGQILLLVRITPTGEDESGGNSPGEDGTSASDL